MEAPKRTVGGRVLVKLRARDKDGNVLEERVSEGLAQVMPDGSIQVSARSEEANPEEDTQTKE